MIRWISGVDKRDEIPSLKLGIKEVLVALRPQRLQRFGHVQHALLCINTISDIDIPCAVHHMDGVLEE